MTYLPMQSAGTSTAFAYTLTTADTSAPMSGQLILSDPPPRKPLTEVERLFGEVDAVCALAR